MTERGRTGEVEKTRPGRDERIREIAAEQTYLDRVYAELDNASARVAMVSAEGFARGRTDRTGDVRDEELTGLFERDALVYQASRRQRDLDTQYEGLVFGRLDLELPPGRTRAVGEPGQPHVSGPLIREVRYVGRLGVRDDSYEPLVIDWRAPAAAPFYRATPAATLGVLRRRVLQCRGPRVVGIEDDLLVPEAPQDLVVVGDGALMAALGRSRGPRMRDIVATIQAHQDEAIRAPARGVAEITGGPGTGKTVVALHRAAYLLYSERRRFEAGGVLVVGPSTAYTAYIERVLPSLGEDSVVLRSLGDLVDAINTGRHDPPDTAALKGSLRMGRVLARAVRAAVPGAPTALRAFVAGNAIRLPERTLDRVRSQALRHHQRNTARQAARNLLGQAAWAQVEGETAVDREEFLATFADHLDVDAFLAAWWPPVDPRQVLLWLADPDLCRRLSEGILSSAESRALSDSLATALRLRQWSIADVALVDDLAHRLGPVPLEPTAPREFYEIDELDDEPAELPQLAVRVGDDADRRDEALMRGRIDRPREYAHVLVDEAQDLSPMQWRMVARRGRGASWTVVGDAAQSSWPDPQEALQARREAFGRLPLQSFRLEVNYRNAAEIFAYAAQVILPVLPDADIPRAVRTTGVSPLDVSCPTADLLATVARSVRDVAGDVDGVIAVIAPARWRNVLDPLVRHPGARGDLDSDLESDLESDVAARLEVVDPLSCKGLEYDAAIIIDPDEIVAESPGGARVLYVALTRAAHRMHIVRPT